MATEISNYHFDLSPSTITELFQSPSQTTTSSEYDEMINKSFEYNSTLKYNYVECRSKLALLNLLKTNSIENNFKVEQAESALKARKSETKEIKKNIRLLETQIFQIINEISEIYRSPDLREKLSESFNSSFSDTMDAEKGQINYQSVIKRYENMLSWYKEMLNIHQVLGGIKIESIDVEKSYTKLTSNLIFYPEKKAHKFIVYFNARDQSFVSAKLTSGLDITDIVNRTKKTNNISFLFREVKNRILHGQQW